MKLRLTSPTFDASAKTIVHSSFSDITLAGIQLIVNVTDQIIIYNFADSTKGGTLSTDTLTLEYDTTSMSDTDELMILVDDGSATTAVSGTVAVTNAGITTIAGAVSGTEMQVDVLTMPSVAVTNAGITTIAGAVAGTEMQVDVLTSALPTGASTSAKQDTVIGHLDGVEGLLTTIDADTGSIDSKTPALGQALAAASVPVVLPAAQITTLTPPAAITGFATSAKQDTLISHVDGIETLLSGTLTVTGGGGGTEYTEGDTDATITGSVAMMEVGGDGVQPIQGTVAGGLLVNLGANNDVTVTGTVDLGATDNAVLDTIAAKDFATQTTLAAINTKLVTGTDIGDVTINNSTGAAAVNIQDGGNTITVDGTVAVTNAGITTIAGAVSGTEMQVDVLTSALPTGASTLAEQQSQTTHLATIAGDTTSIQTATELLDDTVATLGTDTYTEASTKGNIIGAIRRDADTTLVNTTNEVAPLQVDARGALKVEAFSGETLPVSLTSTTVTGTVAVTQSGTWDEVGINDSGNSITVDQPTGSNLHTVVDSGTITTVSAVTAITNALPAGTNAIGKLSANSGVDIGDVDVTSISAGSNLIGDVSLQPRTGNGCTIFRSLDLDESEEEVKATAGNVYGYCFHNKAATTMWLKLYNATAANTTVGTTTPVFTMGLPAGASGNVGFPYPVGFATAISAAVTTGIADNDTGAPAANDVSINIFYK